MVFDSPTRSVDNMLVNYEFPLIDNTTLLNSFAELMILGFISLILTFGQNYITRICIPDRIANTMLPCEIRRNYFNENDKDLRRRLLWINNNAHRILAADSPSKGCKRVYDISYIYLYKIAEASYHCSCLIV